MDISHLSGVPQDLVVTKVINSVWEMAEQGRLGVDKLVIFVDELNKYAPSRREDQQPQRHPRGHLRPRHAT